MPKAKKNFADRQASIADVAQALLESLPDEALDDLARRIAARKVQPVLLDRQQAAKYLGISPEALRKNRYIRPIHLPGNTKPLYRVENLDRVIRKAARTKGVE